MSTAVKQKHERITADDFAPSVGFQIRDLERKTQGSGRRFDYQARVVTGGESYTVHSIYGAWHVAVGGQIKELEAVFGENMGRAAKFELAQRAGSVERKINESMESARKGRVR